MIRGNNTSEEPIILAVDTSAKATSLAVARGGALLRSVHQLADQKRSEALWGDINALLAELDIVIGDVDVLAVCVGPGGFTGLRVGMAAMMGFSEATGKAIVGVSSLEATAFATGPAAAVCAIVNAYKDEVYSQLFSFDGDGVPVAMNEPVVSTVEKAIERVATEYDLVFASNGAEAVSEEINRVLAARHQAGLRLRQVEHRMADAIARLSFLKYKRGKTQTAASLKACYVRPSEAEIKLSLGLLGSKIKRSMKQ